MLKRILAAALSGSLLLTGCDLLDNTGLPLATGTIDLTIVPRVTPGGFTSLAVISPFTAESIDHLVLNVSRLEGTKESPVTDSAGKALSHSIPGDQLSEAVSFKDLLPGTYRIRAFAYKAPGDAAADLISTSGAGSFTDVTLTNDDRPVSTTLQVSLIDVPFNGQATASGIVVTPGGYSTDTPVGISLGGTITLIRASSPFWQSVMPDPTVGMRWTYESWRTDPDGISSAIAALEVTGIQGDAVTYKVEVTMGGQTQMQSVSGLLSRYRGYPEVSDPAYVQEATESLTVPAGTFPNAIKLAARTAYEDRLLWVVPGVGIVKQEYIPRGGPVSYPSGITLKAFHAP